MKIKQDFRRYGNESELLAAIGNPTRFLLLRILSRGRMHLSQLARELNISRPAVIRHLKRLEVVGLVTKTLEDSPIGGSRTYYSISRNMSIQISLGADPPFFDVRIATAKRDPPDVSIFLQEMAELMDAVRKPHVRNVDWPNNPGNLNLALHLSEILELIDSLHQFLDGRRRSLLDTEAKRVLASMDDYRDLALEIFGSQTPVDIGKLADSISGVSRKSLDSLAMVLKTKKYSVLRLLSLVQTHPRSLSELTRIMSIDDSSEIMELIQPLIDAHVLCTTEDGVISFQRLPVVISVRPSAVVPRLALHVTVNDVND